MKQEFNKHKKSDSIKWGIVFFALFLLTVFVIAANTDGFSSLNPYGWFGEEEQPEEELPELPEGTDAIKEAGVEIHNSELLKVSAFRTTVNEGTRKAPGVMLVATVLPETTKDKSVTWTVEFADPNHEWAKGKTASEYLTLNSPLEDTSTVTVTAKKPFAAQLKIVATANSNPQAKAYCFVDYGQKLSENVGIHFSDIFAPSDMLTNNGIQNVQAMAATSVEQLKADYNKGTYSLEIYYIDEYTAANQDESVFVKVRASEALYTTLQEKGIANETNDWVAVDNATILEIYDALTKLLLMPSSTSSGDSLVLKNIDNFNQAIAESDGEYDFEFQIGAFTEFETKYYTIQCKVDRNGPGFAARNVMLSMGNIVL